MANFEHRQLEIGLEFVYWSFAEHNNFSEGSSGTKKDAQVIRLRGAAASRVFSIRITCFGTIRGLQGQLYRIVFG